MIQTSDGISEYPIQAIDEQVLECFEKASNALHVSKKKNIFQILIRTLECFLRVTQKKLVVQTINSPEFPEICALYIGAIYSQKFFSMSRKRRYTLARSFLILIKNLEYLRPASPPFTISISFTTISLDVNHCIIKFEKLEFDEEMLWLWRSWPCTNLGGKVCWFPLYPIYKRLGRSFTHQLYLICCDYIKGRRISQIGCLRSLAKFIEQFPEQLHQNDFKQPRFMGRFWRLFLNYYLINEYREGHGSKISWLCTQWSTSFLPFVRYYLIPSGLFAETYGKIPNPPVKSVMSSHGNIKTTEDGDLVNIKLLTAIPLHITDDVAIQLLFKEIQFDVDIATQWADWAVKDIWKRYQLRNEQSSQGQIVTVGEFGTNNGKGWLIDRNNPDHLKNAATTITHHGHVEDSTLATSIFPRPITQTAHELGLPITGALLPHCILLVTNHPSITPSFLETLELFDKNGKMAGFLQTDGSHKLIGYKRRRGSRLAQQIVSLNAITTLIVEQLIALTTSLRNHLRKGGDDNWRYLLLTCKQGFSKPVRFKKIATETSDPRRVGKFAISLQETSSLNYDQRINYAKRFSLVALRASCGVLVYLRTHSIDDMSKALGHATTDRDLIQRYLPAPILAFFQERWIRIFQAAIIVEALKGSEYLLDASGLGNIHELDLFLNTHALKLPPKTSGTEKCDSATTSIISKDEIVFGVNSEILTLLISLQLAVKNAQQPVHVKARYWSEISEYLIAHIDKLQSYRPDLQSHLEYAKRNANPVLMEAIIHD